MSDENSSDNSSGPKAIPLPSIPVAVPQTLNAETIIMPMESLGIPAQPKPVQPATVPSAPLKAPGLQILKIKPATPFAPLTPPVEPEGELGATTQPDVQIVEEPAPAVLTFKQQPTMSAAPGPLEIDESHPPEISHAQVDVVHPPPPKLALPTESFAEQKTGVNILDEKTRIEQSPTRIMAVLDEKTVVRPIKVEVTRKAPPPSVMEERPAPVHVAVAAPPVEEDPPSEGWRFKFPDRSKVAIVAVVTTVVVVVLKLFSGGSHKTETTPPVTPVAVAAAPNAAPVQNVAVPPAAVAPLAATSLQPAVIVQPTRAVASPDAPIPGFQFQSSKDFLGRFREAMGKNRNFGRD